MRAALQGPSTALMKDKQDLHFRTRGSPVNDMVQREGWLLVTETISVVPSSTSERRFRTDLKYFVFLQPFSLKNLSDIKGEAQAY